MWGREKHPKTALLGALITVRALGHIGELLCDEIARISATFGSPCREGGEIFDHLWRRPSFFSTRSKKNIDFRKSEWGLVGSVQEAWYDSYFRF